MPVSVVDISLNASTGAVPQPTFNDVALIGADTSTPSAGYNNASSYSSPSAVESDFGQGTPVVTASEALAEMGVEDWFVVVTEENEVTDEVVGNSDTSSTTSGTVDNTPIHGDESNISISVDGTSLTAVPKTASPPDVNTSPSNGEAFYNADTGEIVTGTSSSGTGAGIEVSYHYLDWSGATTALQGLGIDLLHMAGAKYGRSDIGDLDEIVSYAGSIGAAVVGPSINGNNATDEDEAMAIAHDVGSYVQSGDYMQVAHKSSEDVGAYITGQLSVNDPWFDPFWDGDGYPFSTDYYSRSLVGDPSTPGTFEGGTQPNQTGNTNVVVSIDGTSVLSNSLTTAGLSSNYRYLDVGRTEAFLSKEAEAALQSLRLSEDRVPYTSKGREQILGTIRGRLSQYASGDNAPLASVTVGGPTIDQISDSDKSNRIFPNITINGQLAGNVHEFGVQLNLRV